MKRLQARFSASFNFFESREICLALAEYTNDIKLLVKMNKVYSEVIKRQKKLLKIKGEKV